MVGERKAAHGGESQSEGGWVCCLGWVRPAANPAPGHSGSLLLLRAELS